MVITDVVLHGKFQSTRNPVSPTGSTSTNRMFMEGETINRCLNFLQARPSGGWDPRTTPSVDCEVVDLESGFKWVRSNNMTFHDAHTQ